MGRKMFVFVLVVLFSVSVVGGCGGGGSASLPTATPGSNNDDGSDITVPPAAGGSDSGGGTSGTGTAKLAWDAPTTNVDGTPLTDLGGYKIYYGKASGNYTVTIDTGDVTSYTINNLGSGTYYIVVTAYNTGGNESGYSNEASKTIL